MKYSYDFICFYSVFFNCMLHVYGFNCHLPEKCRIKKIPLPITLNYNEILDVKVPAIVCDINDDLFEFKVKSSTPLINKNKFCENGKSELTLGKENVIFRWTNTKESTILGKHWNFSNMYNYLSYFRHPQNVRFWGLNGFEINMLEGIDFDKKTFSGQIELSDCRLDFYHEKKRINSCQDLKNANLTTVESIFQIMNNDLSSFVLKSVEYKHTICPLMFSDAFFYLLNIDNMADTFYRKNVIQFSNDTFDDLNLGVYYFAPFGIS